MHRVSPVHIRFENNVKNQMVGTSFEDAVNNKAKKRVKIGASVIFNTTNEMDKPIASTVTSSKKNSLNEIKQNKIEKTKTISNLRRGRTNLIRTNSSTISSLAKSRSFSPKSKNISWCPPPAKTTKVSGESPSSANTSTSHLLKDCDHIPTRDRSTSSTSIKAKKVASVCEVCTEKKSKSRSPSQSRSKSSSSVEESIPCQIAKSNSFQSLSSIESNEDLNRVRILSPLNKNPNIYRCNSQESYFDCCNNTNTTYTKKSNKMLNTSSLSRSHDSLIRGVDINRLSRPFCSRPYLFNSPSSILNPSIAKRNLNATTSSSSIHLLKTLHKDLLMKLAESESNANDILYNLALLKDTLKKETSPSSNKASILKRLDNDRNELIKSIDIYETTNRDLKDIIYDLTDRNVNPIYLNNYMNRNDSNMELLKQIENLEIEKNHYKKLLTELEKDVCFTGTTNEALNMENNALANLKSSLEDNRAHLRRQLLAKESECARLNVQMKNLNRKYDRAQMEIELLRENRERAGLAKLKFPSSNGSNEKSSSVSNLSKSTSNILNKNIKLTKHYYNLEEILSDPIKLRLYIDKLNNQIKEKDAIIKNLNETLISKNKNDLEDQSANTEIKSDRSEKIFTERIRRENEKLKNSLQVKEEKLKIAEQKLRKIEKKLQEAQNKNPVSSDENNSGTFRPIESTPQRDTEIIIQRTKNFSEIELNNVRSLLQARINELEPLPELLKNTELKLHEANLKIKQHEQENVEFKRLISELKKELKNKSLAKEISSNRQDHLLSSTLTTAIQAETNAKQQTLLESFANSKLEPIEKHHETDENKEILRQLALKDEYIRELTNKLANKSNEASSFGRQLELALNDFSIKEKQLKEKHNSKERSLQSKCDELESKLNRIQLHSAVGKRDIEELTQDYQGQIKDLKAKLEQTQIANKQMQDYVNFIKNTYVSYFSDSAFESGSSFL